MRCPWCGNDPLYCRYHDEEWGVPERNGRALFEKLCLEDGSEEEDDEAGGAADDDDDDAGADEEAL